MTNSRSVVAHVPREEIKNLFLLVTGGNNNVRKLFYNKILLSTNDVREINEQILDKLKRYDVSGFKFSAIIAFDNNISREFASWRDFEDGPWGTPNETESLVLKWEFLIQFQNSDTPAPHAITVHFSSPYNIFQALKQMFSDSSDDFETMRSIYSTMSCRIDFADNILSEEMLTLVSKWNKARRSPTIILPIFEKFYREYSLISSIMKYSIPIFVFILISSYYYLVLSSINRSDFLNIGYVIDGFSWFVGLIFAIVLSTMLGSWVSAYTARHIVRLNTSNTFELTDGDLNRQTKIMSKNRNSVIKFVSVSILALALNIAAAIISAVLLGQV